MYMQPVDFAYKCIAKWCKCRDLSPVIGKTATGVNEALVAQDGFLSYVMLTFAIFCKQAEQYEGPVITIEI